MSLGRSPYFDDNDITQFENDYNLGTPTNQLNQNDTNSTNSDNNTFLPDISGNPNSASYASKAPALSAANNYGYAAKPGVIGLASLAPGFVGLAAKTVGAALNAKNVDAVNAARTSLGLPSLSLADMAKGVVGMGAAAKGKVGDVTVGNQSFSVSLDPDKNPTSYSPTDISTISETLGKPVTAATPEASKALAAKAKAAEPGLVGRIGQSLGISHPSYAPTEVTTPTPTPTETPSITATPSTSATSTPTTSVSSHSLDTSLGHANSHAAPTGSMTGIGLDMGRFSQPTSFNPSLTAPPSQPISFNPAAITAPTAAPVTAAPTAPTATTTTAPTSLAGIGFAGVANPNPGAAAISAAQTQGLSTAAKGLATNSAKSLAQGLSDPSSMSPAQAAALGFGPSLSPADAKTVGLGLAGELGPSTVADIAKGQVTAPDVTSIGTVGTTMANRSEAVTGIPGAKANFGNVAATATQPGQYSALNPGKALETSKANYGLNPSAFDAVAQGFFSGALAAQVGLDTAVNNPTASHYANLSVAQPSWAETPSFQATAKTDPTGHTSGKLAEVGYASMTPGVVDAISQAAMEAAQSMDTTSATTGKIGLDNPDFAGLGTPTSALDIGVNQGLSAVGAPSAAAPAATGVASVGTGYGPNVGPNPGQGLASPSLDTGTTGTADTSSSDTGTASADTGTGGNDSSSDNGNSGDNGADSNGANGEGDGEGNSY